MRCPPGSVLRSAAPALVLGLQLLHARSREMEKRRCPCWSTDLDCIHPPTAHRTPHDPECCCLLARSAARKQTPHRAPERRPDAATSAMPPGSPPPSSPRTSRPSCLPCRHVAAFRTMPTRHPRYPRPVGPQKESRHSRTACRPRRLRWQSDLHCLRAVLRPQVAIVVRSNGIAAPSPIRRPAGPSAVVAMPPIVRATRAPPPAAPRSILRSRLRLRRSPRPQNAVPY